MIQLIIQSIENADDCDFIGNLYLNYRRLMHSEVFQITRDKWATEDVVQSVVIKLIDKVQLLRNLSKPELINYIAIASRNTALNYLRSIKKTVDVSYDDLHEELGQYLSETSIDEKLLFRIAGKCWGCMEKT